MSAPTAPTASISGTPGVLTCSWTPGSVTGSYIVTVTQTSQNVVTTVALPFVTTTNTTYTNLVTTATYSFVVAAYAAANGTGTAFTSSASPTITYYNPFGGPQGVQGVQGIAGANGGQGPPGPQGVQGLQGVVMVDGAGSGNTPNYLITTTDNPGKINANSGLTWDGETLNVAANGNTAGVIVTGTGNNSIGGVTLFTGDINAPGTITTATGGSNSVGGVTLMSNQITGATLLNTIVLSGGNVSSMGTLGCGAITSSGALALGANTVACGAITSTGALALGANTVTCGAITSTGALALGTNTVTCGVIAASTTTSTINGLLINSGAVSGVTTLNTITIGSSGNVSGMGTLGCGAITSTGALALGTNTVTCGAITSSGELTASATNVTHRLGNVIFNSNTISWATDGDTGFRFVQDGIFDVVNDDAVTARFSTSGLNMQSKGISSVGTIGCGAITSSGTLTASATNVTHRLGNVTFNSNMISWADDGDSGFKFEQDGVFNVMNDSVVTARFSTSGLNMQSKGISSVGTLTAVDVTVTSDRRLKSDISTISNALETVKGLRGVYFTRIGESRRNVGVIAQEVEEVLPEVVHGDEMKSVSYGNMVGLLIEAFKEMIHRINELENRK